ncbi:hypothetical protein [Nesterenkonia sp. AN1]|uniref:hypothetical protein n=1 Tax=Nesterenkonia sp. AN1 TaxID=652017 RepID=UPI0012680F0C|nr:hypothetical protein [Nesterenkonia sp. AN1]
MVTTLPHGSWPSTISAEQLAVGGNRLGSPQWVGAQLWWSESLAAEAADRPSCGPMQTRWRPRSMTTTRLAGPLPRAPAP